MTTDQHIARLPWRRLLSAAATALSGAAIGATVACHSGASAPKVLNEASDSELAARVICHDTLGRPDGITRRAEVSRCTPCMPVGIKASYDKSLAHARALWAQAARAPYDSLDAASGCVSVAYRAARTLQPDNDSLFVEIALFQLADVREGVRAQALDLLDKLVQRRITENKRAAASAILARFAMGMWDRAQRQLERPADLELSRAEERVHNLTLRAPTLAQLPAIPPTSDRFGASEAAWSARLFDAAARLAASPGERARLMRLSLAPWVVLSQWTSLDSAASALLARSPDDSVLLTARALAAYNQIKQPVTDGVRTMTLFDSALVHMPRVDSSRYDGFDGVLSDSDDEWRYGFLPNDRATLDARGWAVLDPMWSTPVNEVRLAHRARIADADFRYAAEARPGESGSETRAGAMLLRLGIPDAQWKSANAPSSGRRVFRRGWRSAVVSAVLDDSPGTWRVFYGTAFSAARAANFPAERSAACPTSAGVSPTVYACALAKPADWRGLPFYGTADLIDVTSARFRARGDSADVYIAAHTPLRAFKSKDDMDASPNDHISLSAWLTTMQGTPVFRDIASRPLPDASLLAWTTQWRTRVGSLALMHRVEAMEPSRPSGARGATPLTSDAATRFALRGFGLSDVLIAASARPRPGALANRWSDLELQPNAAVIAPNQRFAMVWEIYELTPGPDGRTKWRVSLRRERGDVVSRGNMQDVMTGAPTTGTRVLANESSAPELSYVHESAAAPLALEYITFGLTNAGVGRHVVKVTVEDLVSKKTVSRSVSVRVLVPESQKRGSAVGR